MDIATLPASPVQNLTNFSREAPTPRGSPGWRGRRLGGEKIFFSKRVGNHFAHLETMFLTCSRQKNFSTRPPPPHPTAPPVASHGPYVTLGRRHGTRHGRHARRALPLDFRGKIFFFFLGSKHSRTVCTHAPDPCPAIASLGQAFEVRPPDPHRARGDARPALPPCPWAGGGFPTA